MNPPQAPEVLYKGGMRFTSVKVGRGQDMPERLRQPSHLFYEDSYMAMGYLRVRDNPMVTVKGWYAEDWSKIEGFGSMKAKNPLVCCWWDKADPEPEEWGEFSL